MYLKWSLITIYHVSYHDFCYFCKHDFRGKVETVNSYLIILFIWLLANPHFIAYSTLCNNAHYELNENPTAPNHFYSVNKVLSLSYDRDEICSCNEAFKFAF